MELVSLIFPIYNMERCLRDILDDVFHQTYSNIEIILVNDGSKDGTAQICEEAEKADPRVIYISQENAGLSTARNVGFKRSKGEWIMFIDPDDRMDRDCVKQLMDARTPEDEIVIAGCEIWEHGQKQYDESFMIGDNVVRTMEEKDLLYRYLLAEGYRTDLSHRMDIGAPWGRIYKRNIIDEHNLIHDPDDSRHQDNTYNMYAFFYAKQIRYIDRFLYRFDADHMNSFERENPNAFDIDAAFLKHQYEILQELNLYQRPAIQKAYLQKCYYTMKTGIEDRFRKKLGYAGLKKLLTEIRKEAKIPEIFAKNIVSYLPGKKDKILYLLAYCHLDYLIYLHYRRKKL